ncbi:MULTISPECIES: DUF2147 domain-containing protein [Burkholderia cepacia complex]|uniref:DUF2147 domain-containing protein n=1 Tax=Burkholderia cepacia complex TaxID=87882 RepID=UPI0009BEC414|nr:MULTISPECIES: DUF2147 domain-containing protein [Burkholderia cepacia complex]MCA8119096.1 DUF2147 domain-containing protein [Burkholderia cepacia]MDN8076399.1 DUF2147 domain-containing protein [Burkholderia vietnamiensis]HDR8986778.1 DUF2147 domain-containing protein [Burkholderia vietnamiensis]
MNKLKACGISVILLATSLASVAIAGSPDDAKGLWRSADGDAVIEFSPCKEQLSALCGTIVWDKDAGTPTNACGVRIALLRRYDDDAWRDGWVFDPRSGKHYKGAVRTNDKGLAVRAYIGSEVLGETEQMTREQSLPASPSCTR